VIPMMVTLVEELSQALLTLEVIST
jgi:hypothetical protein